MKAPRSRREFLADVGVGTLFATLGSTLAADLGIAKAFADDPKEQLGFGESEPLVALMQETSVDGLIPVLVAKIKGGTSLVDLLKAAALANARTFGGEDYVGFHTMMALAPALHIARELPQGRAALPVLKVLYRNTSRIQEFGGRAKEVLHPVEPRRGLPEGKSGGVALRDLVRAKDMDGAETTFAGLAKGDIADAFNDLLYAVQDNTEVHRTVLPYRAWDLLGLIGPEHAHTLLRQSVRYCVKSEREWRHTEEMDRPRTLLPKLMDEHKLAGRPSGKRTVDDVWVEAMSRTIFEGTPDQAAEAVAAALAEGIEASAIGEAISLAANQLVLRDAGRTAREVQPGKPLGSVHGDSIGVHACDSANAWRNMAKVANPRNTVACLILGAFQVAHDRISRGGDFTTRAPHPRPEEMVTICSIGNVLLKELDEAIRANEQTLACALVQRHGLTGGDPAAIFQLMIGYAISEDGALHAEKYYRTVREEFASTRPAFRWRQLVALARVTASEYGRPAPGYAEAVELLKS